MSLWSAGVDLEHSIPTFTVYSKHTPTAAQLATSYEIAMRG